MIYRTRDIFGSFATRQQIDCFYQLQDVIEEYTGVRVVSDGTLQRFVSAVAQDYHAVHVFRGANLVWLGRWFLRMYAENCPTLEARYFFRAKLTVLIHGRETAFQARRMTQDERRTHVIKSAALTCAALERSAARKKRDERRSYAASVKVDEASKLADKAKPKEQRFQERRDKRDAKYSVEFQGGGFFVKTAAACALGAIARCFHKISGLVKPLRSAALKLDGIAGSLEQPIGAIREIITNFLSQASKTLGVFAHVIYAIALYQLFKVVPMSPVLKVAVFGLITAKLLPIDLRNIIAHVFHQDDDATPQLQSGGRDIGLLFGSLFAAAAFKAPARAGKIALFMSRISMLDKIGNGWEAFMDWSLKALEACVNVLLTACGRDRVDWLKRSADPLLAWHKKVDNLLVDATTCKENVGSDTVNLMVSTLRDGLAMKQFYYGTRAGRDIDAALGKLTAALIPYQGSLNARNNFRIEPECAVFVGSPGVGKTVTTLYIAAAVLIKSGLLPEGATSEDLKANIWQKGNGKYWNSYAGQHAMIMDDLWQVKGDPTDTENEMMTIIRAVSSWSYPLEFADVASKGKNFFSSKLLLATCNLESIDAHARNFIHEPEAVVRRIGHPYRLLLKPEFATAQGMLDHHLYARELARCQQEGVGLSKFPWHIWEVARHDFISGRTFADRQPLLDVVCEIADRLAAKVRCHTDSEKALDGFVNSLIVQRAEFQSGRREEDVSAKSVKQNILAACNAAVKSSHDFLESLNPLVRTFVCGIAAGFASFKVLAAIKGIVGFFWKCIRGAFHAALEFLGIRKAQPELQSNCPKSIVRKTKRTELQSGSAPITDHGYSNVYRLVIERVSVSYGHLVMVNDRLGVMPSHFDDELSQDISSGRINANDSITFSHVENAAFTVKVPIASFRGYSRFKFEGRELTFIRVADMRAHRNIEKTFVTERAARYVAGHAVRLDTCVSVKGAPTRRILSSSRCDVLPAIDVRDQRVLNVIAYRAATTMGDCGALLSLEDSNNFSGAGLLGIHIAGTPQTSTGYAALITREMVEYARKRLGVINDDFVEDLESRGIELQAGGSRFYGEGLTFVPIGQVAKPVHLAPRTAYYKTPDYGIFGPYDGAPVPLGPVERNGERVYPLLNAIRPYGSPIHVYDADFLRQSTHVAMRKLTAATRGGVFRDILTFEEAVRGISELKFRGIPRSTSPGFPYVYNHVNGKHDFFGAKDDYTFDSVACLELKNRVEHIIERARLNERTAVIFNDFPKDEIRSQEKVVAAAARPISSAPLDYVVAVRQYFGAFTAFFFSQHTVSGMAPGICPYTDWGLLAGEMRKHGPHVFDGDFKAFDASEQPAVHEAILWYINQWYADGEENARIRSVLWADLCHSRHLGGDGTDQRHVYQWNKSLPSGHPLTTVVNSMYSLILLVATYIHLTKDVTGFWDKVNAVTYGDDNIVNVHESVADVYNQATVSQAMSDLFSVRYTSGAKDGTLGTVTTLDRITFLKRGFRCDDDGVWNGPLALDSFLYTVYYCKNKRLEKSIRVDVLETALQELSLHDDATWDMHAPKVYHALERDTVPDAPCVRRDYRAIVRARSDAWY